VYCALLNIFAPGLNLEGNQIGPRGVLSFAEVLHTNSSLSVLVLNDNANTGAIPRLTIFL